MGSGDIAQLISGESPAVRELRRRVARIAPLESTVLLVGETGTGKERVAHAIHALSSRANGALVCINCAALPEHLVESELFGFERGAFTGAASAMPGKFALAEGGTLFLDEIGELSLAAQAKVLRAVESREYYRVGGTRVERLDARLVVATHRDLEAMCASGHFRSDLFYRLNVARVELPSLRERASDILALARHFLREAAAQMRRPPMPMTAEAELALCRYPWPGNVRELRNTVEMALINAEADRVGTADLPANVLRWLREVDTSGDEKRCLVAVLERLRWNKSAAARSLNWSRMKLYRKLREHGLDASSSGTLM